MTAEQRKRETDVVALCNYYTLANKRVAILCNHQKATSANHGEQIAKMDENIEKLKTYPMRSFWPMLCKPDGFERLFCCTYLLYDTIYDDLGCEMDQTYMVVQHTDTLLQDILSKCGSLEDVEEMLTVISSNYREES